MGSGVGCTGAGLGAGSGETTTFWDADTSWSDADSLWAAAVGAAHSAARRVAVTDLLKMGPLWG
jgi:hypothetical protein